ncbi:NAD(P)-binding protein [Backusella circina FSU 941]|nr:NAD(P)-binding protein [Backusella circina FSU 941]
MSEKIFIIGGTGEIGTKLSRRLLSQSSNITLYSRHAEKTKELYPNANVIQGDYTTTDVFEREIVGHTRLFILVSAHDSMPQIKGSFAKIAYGAGVRQIVDISSYHVNEPNRTGFIGVIHRESEEAILAAKGHDQFYVTLRPARFYNTHIGLNGHSIKTSQCLENIHAPESKEDFISSTDIAEVAFKVLTEPVEKHANCVYTMIGDSLSTNERAAIFSEALGKPIKANVIPIQAMYDRLTAFGFPHAIAVDFIQRRESQGPTPYFEVIIGRPPQSFREWLQENNNFEKFK